VFAQLLAVIDKTIDPEQLHWLATALKAVPGELAPADARRVFAQLLAATEEPIDFWQLRWLAATGTWSHGQERVVWTSKVRPNALGKLRYETSKGIVRGRQR
jgi:hypothetical protein